MERERVRTVILELITGARTRPAELESMVTSRILGWGGGQTEVFDEVLTVILMDGLGEMYEHGWQPLDLLHLARRADRRLAPIAAVAVGRQAALTRAEARAPARWLDQLNAAADVAGDGLVARAVDPSSAESPRMVETLLRGGAAPLRAWCDVLQMMGALQGHPFQERLTPPPSGWGRVTPRPGAIGSDRSRVLNKIRGLLAKAEATTFVAEAEACTAKAQDLMTRHAIDAAVLGATDDDPVAVLGVRVHLESPYVDEKAHLLNVVAGSNRVRMIFDKLRAMATILGTPIDVDQVEMLFASLLIQATRSMAQVGSTGIAGSSDRSTGFRRGFLAAYAIRVGERLSEADRQATDSYGEALVPVLARQHAAVDAEYDRLFPRTRTVRSRAVDARGWHAGRLAADRAVIVAGRLTP